MVAPATHRSAAHRVAVRPATRTSRRTHSGPDRFSILGTLAHRATLMSFQKPWRAGHIYNTDLPQQVAANADLLLAAMRETSFAEPGSHLRSVIDPGGPFWSAAVDDYAALTVEDRVWVQQHLRSAAIQAAHLIAEDDAANYYASLRSEVQLDRLDVTDTATVADLVGITRDGRVIVIDLKFVAGGFPVDPRRRAAYDTQVRRQLKLVRDGLRQPGAARCTRKVEGWLLYVSYLDRTSAWVPVG